MTNFCERCKKERNRDVPLEPGADDENRDYERCPFCGFEKDIIRDQAGVIKG